MTGPNRSVLAYNLDQLVNLATASRWIVPGDRAVENRIWVTRDSDRARWAPLPPRVRQTLERVRRQLRSGQRARVIVGVRETDPLVELKAAQRITREILDALTRPGTLNIAVGTSANHRIAVEFDIECGQRGDPWVFDVNEVHSATLPDALAVALLLLVKNIPPSQLRRCPYVTGGDACQRIFLAVKAQEWCSTHRIVVRREQLRRSQSERRAALRKSRREWRSTSHSTQNAAEQTPQRRKA